MTDPAKLSKRERQIMDVIYLRGKATVSEVLEGIESPPSRTAIRTLIGILETKGHLQHKQQGREYLYSPTRPRKTAGRSMLRNVVGTFFDGSVEKALAAHFTDPQTKLTEDELDRIASLIAKAKERKVTMNPIIEFLVRGFMIALAGIFVTYAFKKASPKIRSRVLTCSLISLLILPCVLLSKIRWRVLPAPSTPIVESNFHPQHLPIPQPAIPQPTLSAPIAMTSTQAISWPTIFKTIYGLGFVIALMPMLSAWIYLRRLRQNSRRCHDQRIEELASEIDPTLPDRLHLSTECRMPMTWGTFRPIILLPETAIQWRNERLNAVLLHEHGHVRRRDGLTVLIAQAARALHWPNPLVWWIVRRWSVEAEFACDAHAIQTGAMAEDYAAALYDFAKEHSAGEPVALPMAKTHAVEARVKAALTTNNMPLKRAALSITTLLLAAITASIIAEEQPLTTKRYHLNGGIITVPAQEFLQKHGIAFPKDTSLTYSMFDRELLITHSSEIHDEIERALAVNGLLTPSRPPARDTSYVGDPQIHTLERTFALTPIPDIELPQATLASAIVTLRRLAIQHTPEGRTPGKILIDEKSIDQEKPYSLTAVHDLSVPAAPLGDVLWYITQRWEVSYSLSPEAVTISPAIRHGRYFGPLSLSLPPGRKVPPGFIEGDAEDCLRSKGINFEGTRPSAAFDESTNYLHVKTSIGELARLNSLIWKFREKRIQESLELIIPEFNVDDASLDQVVATLQEITASHFKKILPDMPTRLTIQSTVRPGITLSLDLNNKSLRNILDVVSNASETTYELDPLGISIIPKPSTKNTDGLSNP